MQKVSRLGPSNNFSNRYGLTQFITRNLQEYTFVYNILAYHSIGPILIQILELVKSYPCTSMYDYVTPYNLLCLYLYTNEQKKYLEN